MWMKGSNIYLNLIPNWVNLTSDKRYNITVLSITHLGLIFLKIIWGKNHKFIRASVKDTHTPLDITPEDIAQEVELT